MGLSSALIYTSELILCSTISVNHMLAYVSDLFSELLVYLNGKNAAERENIEYANSCHLT